ncbi:MAG: SH3 domain-containing protein, partial [Leptospiraceae bacterium]|nr:SH3 domain-containing protein [Leptospiraceae bacterium]
MIKKFIIAIILLSSCLNFTFNSCNLRKDTNEKIDKKYYFVTSSDGLMQRDIPGLKGKKIQLIPFKSMVEFLENTEEYNELYGIYANWKKVSFNGKEGYVFSGFLVENLEEYINDKKLSWKELDEKAVRINNSEYASKLYALSFLKRNGRDFCFPYSDIGDYKQCIKSCTKKVEVMHCKNSNQNLEKITFENLKNLIIENLRNKKIDKLLSYSNYCIQEQYNCYYCDSSSNTLTMDKYKLILNHYDKINFQKVKLDKKKKEIILYAYPKVEKHLYHPYEDVDRFWIDLPFIRFKFINIGRGEENWRIGKV